MNKHQRVRAAIAGSSVDYVPSAFWLHFPERQFFGPAAVQAHIDFYRDTDVDLLKVMNEHLYRVDTPIHRLADWASWRPFALNEAVIQNQVDIVKGVADALGSEVPLIATIHGVFSSAFNASVRPGETLRGINILTEHLRKSPEAVEPALDAVCEALIDLSVACLQAGAAGVYYAALGGEAYRFDDEVFENYVMRFDLRLLNELRKHTDLLVLHICKDQVPLPRYLGYPGDVVNWAIHESEYSLKKGKELFGKTVLGGLDDRSGVLVDGEESEIRTEVRRLVESAGKTCFILGADCTLPTEIDLSRVRIAVDAARTA